MNKAKDISDVTDLPEGLDVIPAVPGTFVGGHDVQGVDGKVRTDRPGAILGTPVTDDATIIRADASRRLEADKADAVTEAVDRNNREVLPLLGGPQYDDWERGEIVVEPPAGILTEKERTARDRKAVREADKADT